MIDSLRCIHWPIKQLILLYQVCSSCTDIGHDIYVDCLRKIDEIVVDKKLVVSVFFRIYNDESQELSKHNCRSIEISFF